MSQGEGSRWRPDVRWTHIDVPADVKQLIPLGNETILTRTLRQVSTYVPQIDTIVVMNKKYSHYLPSGTALMSLDEPTGFLLRGIWIACEWSDDADRTIILLGDVVYSNDAIKKIFAEKHKARISLFGRLFENPATGKEAKELFALSCKDADYDDLRGIILNILKDRGRPTARLWDLYGFFGAAGATNVFEFINDFTDDVDSIQEYALFFDKLEEAALKDDEKLFKN
jgi:hypothetical protein